MTSNPGTTKAGQSADGSRFRRIPSVDALLRLQDDEEQPLALATRAARLLVEELRSQMRASWPPEGGEDSVLGDDALRRRLAELRADEARATHRRVLNVTGILLHTGLGRAPLAERARDAMREAAGAAYVEVDANSGKRNRREDAIAAHLCALTGVEAATVVNNNAAATLLGLQALAEGHEVPLSRGELVEIGGGFRMPDVMRQAGCKLVEVGTTNRTRLRDFEAVLGEDTGCLLKVHPSNYRIEGFFEEVSLVDLVALGRAHDVKVMEDLGAGWLLDEPLPHDPREPGVLQSAASGADIVCFSGDKLLGGCQAGFLIGREEAIDRVKRHPMYRALRLGKCELAALEATLWIYRFGEPKREIPVLRALFAPLEELEARAAALLTGLEPALRALGYGGELRASQSYVGSGSSPARPIESRALWLRASDDRAPGVEELAKRLRLSEPGVFARIEDASLVLDMRSLAPESDGEVVEVFGRLGRA